MRSCYAALIRTLPCNCLSPIPCLGPIQPIWHNPNALPARPLKKYTVSLHHTPQDSRVSRSAPYGTRKTLGSPTRAQATGGRPYLAEPYNSLNDPHLANYYSKKFEASRTKVFKVSVVKALASLSCWPYLGGQKWETRQNKMNTGWFL